MRLFCFLIALLTLVGCTGDPAPPPPALGTAGQPRVYADFAELAPLFEQQNDTAYVVNFWATWCKPCREEIPLLQRFAAENTDRKLRVVLVSLDTEQRAIDRIPDFLGRTAPDLASVVLTDEGQQWGKTIDRAWNGSLPTTILYKGALRYVVRREFRTYADLEGAVAPLFGE